MKWRFQTGSRIEFANGRRRSYGPNDEVWGDEEILEEGCLSLPGVHVDVERPIYVRVRAQDPTGEPIVVEASGLEARVIQHEMDHLYGVLILDRTPRDQRKEAMRTLRERVAAALPPRSWARRRSQLPSSSAWPRPTIVPRSSSRAPTGRRAAGAG